MAATGRALSNVFWLTAERILRIGVSVIVLAAIARHLQPTAFGELSFALSFTGLFTPLAFFGLEGLLVAQMVRQPEKTGALLGTAALLRFIAGIASVALCLGLTFGLPALRSEVWIILPLSLGLLWQSVEVIDLWFQRHLRSRTTATLRFGVIVLGAIVKLILVWRQAPVTAFAWAVMADVLAFQIGLLVVYRRSGPERSPWSVDWTLARALASRAWPLAIAALLLALQNRIDQFVVKAVLPAPEAATYFAAVRFIELPLYLITSVAVSTFPTVADRAAADPALRPQPFFDLLAGCGWTLGLLTAAGGPWLVPLVLGPAYEGTGPALVVLAACLVPWALTLGRFYLIIAALPTSYQVLAALLGTALQFLLAVWWVPRLGAPGAALANGVTALVAGWLTSFLWPRLRPLGTCQARALLIPFRPADWKPAFALLR